jgi:hypothetical protein
MRISKYQSGLRYDSGWIQSETAEKWSGLEAGIQRPYPATGCASVLSENGKKPVTVFLLPCSDRNRPGCFDLDSLFFVARK